jgi:uncharacterized protein
VRAVLDPNVLISALLSPRGAPAHLIARWRTGDFDLVVSNRVLVELRRALRYPRLRARISPEEADEFVVGLRELAVVARDPRTPPRRSVDPGDDYLLALAESQGAVLVSGDRHPLDLAAELPVRSPRDFLRSL